jgi:hypothetical protein
MTGPVLKMAISRKKKIKKIQNNSNHHLGKQEIQKRELH